MKVRWEDLKDPPDYDLAGYVRGRIMLDVVSGVDGWTVKTPTECWAHDGTQWVSGPKNAPPRGKPGAVTREEARLFAETLIGTLSRL